MSLSKRIRFEVFKRDSFTCQYCGKKAPDVVLHADHIDPKANGGGDEITNIITACEGCNLGKAAVPLSDDTAVSKQRDQLARLQERQEQIEMMMQWQRTLIDLDEQTVNAVAAFWCELANWFSINEAGERALKKLIRKWGQESVLEAMRLASETYFRYADGTSSTPTDESAELGFSKIGGICSVRAASAEKPHLQNLFYIRGILRNRARSGDLSYFDERRGMELLESAFEWGGDAEEMKRIAKLETTWSRWRDEMLDYIEALRGEK